MSETPNVLRLQYIACISLADETDSKREDRELREDAAKLLKELRRICPHEKLVSLRDATKSYGSYDEPEDELRLCLMCGTEESAATFKILTAKPLARFPNQNEQPPQVTTPLRFLLSECEHVATEKGYPYIR